MGTPVDAESGIRDVPARIRALKPGEAIRLSVFRSGKVQELSTPKP
jgi:hypothetical protein